MNSSPLELSTYSPFSLTAEQVFKPDASSKSNLNSTDNVYKNILTEYLPHHVVSGPVESDKSRLFPVLLRCKLDV